MSTQKANSSTPGETDSSSSLPPPEITEPTYKKPEKSTKRRKKKLEIACVYCRRSHMICDESRPCQRCIKRGIAHLCYDEPSNSRQRKKAAALRKTQSEGAPMVTSPITLPLTGSTGNQLPLPLPPLQASQLDIRSAPKTENSLQFSQPALHQQQMQENPQGASQSVHTNNTHIYSSQNQQQQPQHQQQLQQQQPQPQPQSRLIKNSVLSQTLPYNQQPFFYSEHANSEFSSLNDFLSMIDDPELVNGALNDDTDGLLNFGVGNNNNSGGSNSNINNTHNNNNNGFSISGGNSTTNLNAVLAYSPNSNLFPPTFSNEADSTQIQSQQQQPELTQQPPALNPVKVEPQAEKTEQQPVISDSARDKFFLTAADPTTEISPEERLKQVIKAKLEAGLLQPYNYAKGYARLQRYMDNYMNISSRQRILKPLSIFRPAFRAIARTLKDVDLVLVEESFERMLLDYDRVFTAMAIPACLWRRTGEIYRGNKEFASLVGVTTDDLKDGKLAIYELMSEESAVNFWEKYGAIAFDKGQKAVLTSCNLRTRDGIKRKSCCFSFTIRRDRYNIPSCIVGNFIPIDP